MGCLHCLAFIVLFMLSQGQVRSRGLEWLTGSLVPLTHHSSQLMAATVEAQSVLSDSKLVHLILSWMRLKLKGLKYLKKDGDRRTQRWSFLLLVHLSKTQWWAWRKLMNQELCGCIIINRLPGVHEQAAGMKIRARTGAQALQQAWGWTSAEVSWVALYPLCQMPALVIRNCKIELTNYLSLRSE